MLPIWERNASDHYQGSNTTGVWKPLQRQLVGKCRITIVRRHSPWVPFSLWAPSKSLLLARVICVECHRRRPCHNTNWFVDFHSSLPFWMWLCSFWSQKNLDERVEQGSSEGGIWQLTTQVSDLTTRADSLLVTRLPCPISHHKHVWSCGKQSYGLSRLLFNCKSICSRKRWTWLVVNGLYNAISVSLVDQY